MRPRWVCSILLVLALLLFSSIRTQAQPVEISVIIQQALQKAPQILQAKEDVAAAELELALVRGNVFIPQLSVSAVPLGFSYEGGQGKSTGSATLALGLSLPTGTALRLNYNGSLSYTDGAFQSSLSGQLTQILLMDLSLTDTAIELQRKQAAVDEAKQTLLEVQRQVMLEVLNGLLNLLVVQESVEIARARVDLSQARLEEVRSKVERGQAGRLDLLAAQIELRQNELASAKLQRDSSLSQEKFFNSFALEKTLSWRVPNIAAKKLQKLAEGLLQEEITPAIISKDPQVRRASREVVEAERTLNKTKQDAFPSLGLTMNYEERSGWGIGISFSHSLFTGQELKIKEAERALVTARRTLESARESTKLDIVSQRNALQEAYSQMEVITLKGELLALQQEMKQQQMERGLISTGEWDEFLIQKRDFENEYRAALYQLIIAYLTYRNSLGMSFSLEEVFSDEQNY